MAGSLNKVTIIGNVGKDPEIRSTQSGKEIASFSVACSESYKNKQTGERETKTQWIPVNIFNEALVGIVKQYVKKGSKVYVEGAWQNRSYTDKDGTTKYITEVVLQAFNGKLILLDGKDADEKPTAHNEAKKNAYVHDEIDDNIPF